MIKKLLDKIKSIIEPPAEIEQPTTEQFIILLSHYLNNYSDTN